ncbi:FGGY family of carbohydrate kinases, C-terminal domain [Nesidiocoris tenuis]|uniref:FGGY family of carbohydrate kinases, C-terminal domain n=1 Tax=Nesidiocoris tenuis TaxID=355587 RepID=A0ABN7B0A7_9HEMI|nr:FGGY family of carbohydrate kinases, C-terminal domain [Nesidiocoris tenuis]
MPIGDSEDILFVGVDVGTGSARAGLVDRNGRVLKSATKTITTWSPRPNYYQQSTEDIWDAICYAVREVTRYIEPEHVKGIGFDATCSLVAVGVHGHPVTISPDCEPEQDVILWMDHRAGEEADAINLTDHPLLKNVGGKVSLEMQLPKLMWLKKHLHQCWDHADRFFDLPDFLTWKATGNDSRSLCSVVCKWMFDASPDTQRWSKELLSRLDMNDLLDHDCHKIGSEIKSPGSPCGEGLSPLAARDLDLLPGTPVGTSIIDAHAGGLGLIGCRADNFSPSLTSRLCLIGGTSTCHMAVSHEKLFVPGVWGPYYSAMVPDLWLNEAGQSATGRLIDHIIDTHPATAHIYDKLPEEIRVVEYLNDLLTEMAAKANKAVDLLTKDIHVWPDFHGNRSPVADPSLKGMICGLDLSSGEEQLALLYLATLQALSYGTRHVMEVMEESGHKFETILVCGGLSKNPMFVRSQANAVSKAVLVPEESESVLVGAAILGATASGIYKNVLTAVKHMGSKADKIEPSIETQNFHDKKFKVFKNMLEHQLQSRRIMDT